MSSTSPPTAVTVRVLVRNLESNTGELQFSDFTIKRVSGRRALESAREVFPEAFQDEWILTREFRSINAVEEDWSGFGDTPNRIEDLLLLLRLFRPGDLSFAAMLIEDAESKKWRQYPYRMISPIVANASTRQYVFNQTDCETWQEFAAPLLASEQWGSRWFSIARRFFLYGGGKEFNANFESEVDRVIDYITALEATLVPESELVSRRLRERAQQLLDLQGDSNSSTLRELREMYQVRSTLVHGSPLSIDQLDLLRDRGKWWQFEGIVRGVLVEALRRVPSDDPQRRAYLASLYDVTDNERAEQVRQYYRAMRDDEIKRDLLDDLARPKGSSSRV